MHVVFLDIDGVLNDLAWNDAADSSTLDSNNVVHLNRIIAEADAKLVISSSWRDMIIRGEMSLKGFELLLRTHGVQVKDRVIGHTPPDEHVAYRGDQIAAWLDDHKDKVRAFVVLDDMVIYEPSHVAGRQVVTDGNIGLTEEKAAEVIQLFNC